MSDPTRQFFGNSLRDLAGEARYVGPSWSQILFCQQSSSRPDSRSPSQSLFWDALGDQARAFPNKFRSASTLDKGGILGRESFPRISAWVGQRKSPGSLRPCIPQNILDHINNQSTALSFLELFLHADFGRLLCRQTNLQVEQVKQSNPASYYAKNFKCVAVPERYESYWQEAGHNFIYVHPRFQGSHGTRPLGFLVLDRSNR